MMGKKNPFSFVPHLSTNMYFYFILLSDNPDQSTMLHGSVSVRMNHDSDVIRRVFKQRRTRHKARHMKSSYRVF